MIELSRRMEDLEKEIENLRAELAQLKQQAGSASAGALLPASYSPAAVLAAPATAPPAPAANPVSTLLGSATLSGLVDVYYGYNLNQPHTRMSGLRAFDGPSSQFALNLVELTLDKPVEPANSRLGYHLALGFGQAMNAVNSTDSGGLGFAQYLKEAYVSYLAPVGKGLQVDVGKFVTPHGAEVIETKDNWNYARGLLFSYAIPYYHFGLRLKYSFNNKYSLAGFLVNGWNNITDNNTGKTLGVSLGWNPTKKISLTETYMAGPEQTGTNAHWRQLSDTLLTYSPTGRLSLMLNYNYGRGDQMPGVDHPVFWTGVAGYLRYSFNDRYALAARYEYFDDHDGFTTGMAQHLYGFTGTFQRVMAHHLITRLEFRRDFSNRPAFLKGEAPVPAQNTFTGGLVYVFDVRGSR